MEGFDLKVFESKRNKMLSEMNSDPVMFASTMYKVVRKKLYSPYMFIDEPSLCCLISGVEFPNIKRAAWPEVCSKSKIEPIAKKGKVSEPHVVSVGKDKYVLKVLKMRWPKMDFFPSAPTSSKYISQKSGLCNIKDVSEYSYISSDEFTNELLIAYLLEIVFAESDNLTNFVKYYSGTICTGKWHLTGQYNYSALLMEYCDMGSLDNLGLGEKFKEMRAVKEIRDFNEVNNYELVKSQDVLNIFHQVLASLHYLQKQVQFVHGDLKVANIFVCSKPFNANYKGLAMKAPYTIKLGDYGKSSITMYMTKDKKPFRFYNRSRLSDAYLALMSFKPNVSIYNNEQYYEIGTISNAQMFAHYRHMGVPFYQTFDTYTFIVSYLLIPQVFYAVFTDPKLKGIIWDPLWAPDESSKAYSLIMKELRNKDSMSIKTPLNILRKLRLKCDITNNLVEQSLIYL